MFILASNWATQIHYLCIANTGWQQIEIKITFLPEIEFLFSSATCEGWLQSLTSAGRKLTV